MPNAPDDDRSALPAPRVHVRMVVGGVRVEFRGRQTCFDRYVAPLLEGACAHDGHTASPERAPPAPPQGPMFRPASPTRFKQFAMQVGARAAKVDQRIMAFAFYLWNYEKRDEFSAPDVESFLRTLQEEPPADLGARLAALDATQRFLESGAQPATWRLTTKGVNYVKNRLLGPG